MGAYADLASKLGLSEEQMLEAALVESLADAKHLEDHIKMFDTELKAQGLVRAVVPGDGNCQYHALVRAAQAKGLDLGSMNDVRAMVYRQLMADPIL